MNAWERRSDETAKAFAAFVVYRELGAERSLEKVRQKYGKGTGWVRVCERWSSRYSWVDRARAWDDHQDAVRWADAEKLRDKARRKILERAATLVDKSLDIAEGTLEGTPVQVAMLKDLLARAGLDHPKVTTTRTVETGAGGAKTTETTTTEDAASLSPADLHKRYRERLGG